MISPQKTDSGSSGYSPRKHQQDIYEDLKEDSFSDSLIPSKVISTTEFEKNTNFNGEDRKKMVRLKNAKRIKIKNIESEN